MRGRADPYTVKGGRRVLLPSPSSGPSSDLRAPAGPTASRCMFRGACDPVVDR